MGQLPPPGSQARPHVAAGGASHPRAACSLGEQVVEDSEEATRPHGQRDQELLEDPHEEEGAGEEKERAFLVIIVLLFVVFLHVVRRAAYRDLHTQDRCIAVQHHRCIYDGVGQYNGKSGVGGRPRRRGVPHGADMERDRVVVGGQRCSSPGGLFSSVGLLRGSTVEGGRCRSRAWTAPVVGEPLIWGPCRISTVGLGGRSKGEERICFRKQILCQRSAVEPWMIPTARS